MKKIKLFTLLVFISLTVFSQTIDKKWAVGLGVGPQFNLYNNGSVNPIGDLYFSRYLSPSLDVMLKSTLSIYKDNVNDKISIDGLNTLLDIRYKFYNGKLMPVDSKIQPYAFLGGGMFIDNGESGPNFDLGIGAKYPLNKSVALFAEVGYINGINIKNEVSERKEDFIKAFVGIEICFGKEKDSDGDGVSDGKDKCPNTPKEAKVDENGCPKDSDGDGIADYLDKCPNVAGLAKFNGCPDTDGDGIADNVDACPTVAGLEKFKGCPDTDGDGIADKDDACPTVAGIEKFKGCPDTDGDGIADKDDECPTIAGLEKFKGCPDTDGDGIADKDDACPTVAGTKKNKGCPDVSATDQKVFDDALKGIQFETGKDVIKTGSYPILDNVVKVMNNHPEYKLFINGHTDSQGDANKNMTLSQNRANAVMKYLIDKGVSASKLTAKGYGITMPIATNDTAAGRAINRRVEFKIEF